MPSEILIALEKEIGLLILDKLEHLEITPERAANIAQFVLLALPNNLTDIQVRAVIPSLDETFYELAAVVYKHMQSDEVTRKTQIQRRAERLIKNQRIEEANQLMKQYFQTKKL